MANQLTSRLLAPVLNRLVLRETVSGKAVIPNPTPLTRLNYFDGKFLRADDLNTEQRYLTQLIAFGNQVTGPGVAYGFDVSRAGGDALRIGEGLAIDPPGRALFLPEAITVKLQELIEQSRAFRQSSLTARIKRTDSFEECEVVRETPPIDTPQAGEVYLLTIAYAEAACGEENVYGKLCEEACVTSTDRPYWIEGVLVRAIPLSLRIPLPTSSAVALDATHLRSRVASAYFADEAKRIGDLISAAGLRANAWCFGADAAAGQEVPIAVVGLKGSAITFIDAWIARREIFETPARHYWQWRMAMRPMAVFFGHIFQFQCQLQDAFRDQPTEKIDMDPCDDLRRVAREATEVTREAISHQENLLDKFKEIRTVIPRDFVLNFPRMNLLKDIVTRLDLNSKVEIQNRILIRRGIVELPSAGYLPVAPNVTVNSQVSRLLGEGLDLRFCVVRPDYVPHALEEAQHMERISLLRGLDDPKQKPKVDILVPDGEIESRQVEPAGRAYEARVLLSDVTWNVLQTLLRNAEASSVLGVRGLEAFVPSIAVSPLSELGYLGAARTEAMANGGNVFYLAALLEEKSAKELAKPLTGAGVFLDAVREAAPFERPAAFLRSAAMRAALGGGTAIGPLAGTVPSKTPQFSAAMWSAMRMERDFFALQRPESGNLSGEFSLARFSDSASMSLELRFNGSVQIENQIQTAQSEQIQGRFLGDFTVSRLHVSGTSVTPSSRIIPVNELASLRRDQRADGATVIAFSFPSLSFLRQAAPEMP